MGTAAGLYKIMVLALMITSPSLAILDLQVSKSLTPVKVPFVKPVSPLRPTVLPYEVQSSIVDLMEEKDFTSLKTADFSAARPIYRKDLKDFVAYYELTTKEGYFLFSSSVNTGDHRLVESGKNPRPTDVLNKRAKAHGETCIKYYRISATTGLYTCENGNGMLVAATYNWVNDAPVSSGRRGNYESFVPSYSGKSRLYQVWFSKRENERMDG